MKIVIFATDGRMDGRTDRRTSTPILLGHARRDDLKREEKEKIEGEIKRGKREGKEKEKEKGKEKEGKSEIQDHDHD